MTMVSKLAIAAALSLGVIATPALAQKKGEKEQAAPALKVSEAFRKPAAAAEKALKAGDWATAEKELIAAEAVAKNEDEKFFAAVMRLPIEIHKQSRPGIIAAADVLIANPKTPAANLGLYNYYRGQATFQMAEAGKRAPAAPFLLKARELGVDDPDLALMLAQIYDETGRRPEGIVEMGKVIDGVKAKGQKPQESWYKWAYSRAAASGDRALTSTWQMRYLRDFPNVVLWRNMIINYRNANRTSLDKNGRIALYRLMRGTGALADNNDYFEYAALAQQTGLPWEAITVIDLGRKAGKVPQGDADFAKVETASKTAISNEGSLETQAKAAKTGPDLEAVGDAFLASGDYARAIELYDQALAKGGVNVDQVNISRGAALVFAGRKDEAKASFEKITTAGTFNDLAKFWLLWMELPPLAA